MTKLLTRIIIPVFIIALFLPFFDVQASGGTFTYRLTKMGAGTRQTGEWEYKITNEKYDFSTSESVFALTRIFNITNVDTFQFKYEIRGTASRDMFSPIYRPARSWWAEIWYWDEFGKLPSGNYDLRALISVDGEAFRHLESKQFKVGVLDHDYNYNNYSDNYNNVSQEHDHRYTYAWTETDDRINFYGNYKYGVNDPRDIFNVNEDIKVLTRLSNIENIDNFKIRHELHKNGYFVRKIESSDRRPNKRGWEYNYTESNFGKLSAGNYEIKVYLSIEGRAWKMLDIKRVGVSSNPYLSDNYNYDWTRVGSDFNYPDYPDYGYYGVDYPYYVNFPFTERQF